MISAVLHTDPACPWAYSAIPALRALDWRYGDQLQWRLVVIGLTEHAEPVRRARVHAPGRGCRPGRVPRPVRDAVGREPEGPGGRHVARVPRRSPPRASMRRAREWRVLRALQLANFTTPMLLDEDRDLAAALREVPGVDGAALVARLDGPAVAEAYERDRSEARQAAGTAAEAQDKTPRPPTAPLRFTAPSIVFERDGQRLVAGGWQPALVLRRPAREPRPRRSAASRRPRGRNPSWRRFRAA